MMSAGTMQDFRSAAWNSAPSSHSSVWTTVNMTHQNTPAWPITQHPIYMGKNTKMVQNSVAVSVSPSFQWSNSWDPVIIAQRTVKKSPSPPFNTSPNVNVPIPIKTQKKMVDNGSLTYELYESPTATIIAGSYQSTIFQNGTEDSLIYSQSPEEDGEFGSLKRKNKKSPEEKQLIEDELSKQNLYKTELCRSFCETGICRYGHKCQFAHGEHELRPVMRHPKYKTETCKTFSNTGTCPYGNRCRFIHPGVNYGSWPDDGSFSDQLIGSLDALSISPSPLAMGHPHILGFQVDPQLQQAQQQAPMPAPYQPPAPIALPPAPHQQNGTFVELKDKESDVKAIVEEDSDSKPRLAFFQNLTVI